MNFHSFQDTFQKDDAPDNAFYSNTNSHEREEEEVNSVREEMFGTLLLLLASLCFTLSLLGVSEAMRMCGKMNAFHFLFARFFVQLVGTYFQHCDETRFDYNSFCAVIVPSVSFTMAHACLYQSLETLSLFDTCSIYLASPMFIAPLSFFVLREKCTFLICLSIPFCISGFLFFTPLFDETQTEFEHALPLATAFSFTVFLVSSTYSIRNHFASLQEITFWSAFVGIFVPLVALDLPHTVKSFEENYEYWFLAFGSGFCGSVASLVQTYATHLTDPWYVPVIEASEIAWALLFQVTIQNLEPEWTAYIGSFLILISIVMYTFAAKTGFTLPHLTTDEGRVVTAQHFQYPQNEIGGTDVRQEAGYGGTVVESSQKKPRKENESEETSSYDYNSSVANSEIHSSFGDIVIYGFGGARVATDVSETDIETSREEEKI